MVLYHIPPDKVESVFCKGQTVFGWVVESGIIPSSNNDEICLSAYEENQTSYCARLKKSKCEDFCKKYGVDKLDTCFLIVDDKVSWHKVNPTRDLIIKNMKFAIEPKENPNKPKGPVAAPRGNKQPSSKGIQNIIK